MFKKEKGESAVSGAAMLALTVLCIFVLLSFLLNYTKTIYTEEEVHTVARNYLLKMELSGGLEQQDVEEILTRLSELGMSEIQLSGNFGSTVTSSAIKENLGTSDYGEVVSFTIKGSLNSQSKIINFLGTQLNIGSPTVNVDITKKGVCVK